MMLLDLKNENNTLSVKAPVHETTKPKTRVGIGL